jgi:hypothetical protein
VCGLFAGLRAARRGSGGVRRRRPGAVAVPALPGAAAVAGERTRAAFAATAPPLPFPPSRLAVCSISSFFNATCLFPSFQATTTNFAHGGGFPGPSPAPPRPVHGPPPAKRRLGGTGGTGVFLPRTNVYQYQHKPAANKSPAKGNEPSPCVRRHECRVGLWASLLLFGVLNPR